MIKSVHFISLYFRVIQTLMFAVPIWLLIYIGEIAFNKDLFLLQYLSYLSFPGVLIAAIIAAFKGNIHAIGSIDLWIGHVLFYFFIFYVFVSNSRRFKNMIEKKV